MGTIEGGPLTGGRLSYLFVDVHDLDAMLAFYRDTLGLPVVFEDPGACAFLELGGGPKLALYTGRNTGSGATAHFLVVIDVDDLRASAAALGSFNATDGSVSVIPRESAKTSGNGRPGDWPVW